MPYRCLSTSGKSMQTYNPPITLFREHSGVGRVVTPAIIAVLGFALWAVGQEIEVKEVIGGLAFVDEVRVTVVNIDVFLRDRAGKVVTGPGA